MSVQQKSEVRVCTRCVMNDAADPTITFDEKGVCNYCTEALAYRDSIYFPGASGEQKQSEMIDLLKKAGASKNYDCLMGLSGGLDSSYLAYLGAAKWGLRIAAVHVDDGFDTEVSANNISKLCSKAGIELVTIRPDEEQFNALTKAYMKAGVPNLAVPQDNALFAALYAYAKKHKISYFLSGENYALECVLQKGNTWDAYDLVNLKDIHKKFGDKPIDKLRFMSPMQRRVDERVLHLRTLKPLNYVNYNRDRAFQELHDYCGYEYYGRKHLENYLTAFVQLCWFPRKFGVDKRTSHLSSMVVSGQMTREEALVELEEPLCTEEYYAKLVNILCAKLEMTEEELESYLAAPGRQHDEFRTDTFFYRLHNAYQRLKGRA